MKNPLPCRIVFTVALACFALVPASQAASKSAKNSAKNDAARDDAVRLQIFLDQQNFGPGKIDGSFGGFTKLAWNRYQQAQGTTPKNDFNAHAAPISSNDPVYITYTVTAQDLGSIGQVPAEVPEQAKLQSLPYTSMAELLGERYHTSVEFLRKLNAPKNLDQLKEGDQVKVPNVTPIFDLSAVTAERDAAAANAKKKPVEKKTGERKKKAADAGESSPSPTPPADEPANGNPSAAAGSPPAIDIHNRYVHVSVKDAYLEVREGDKQIAGFPVTPGSTAIPSPKGEWKIESKTLMPVFRYDKAMLDHGERSDDFHHLPPGPNNPVGITWIALNKKGIGLHGTSEADTVGRSASHGCIRLANWDAYKLFGMVDKGMRVVIE